ncbi:NADPH:quinone oxidoreductase family protein [Mycobacterium sp. CVI_P3]|uniref:NADPH:quinone oxidoreductase family protein n=1 Tax=Mycobacterium pinniadriaticum TaxID=2994102 RepID=A0ABT3S7W0_9MYCO|nr:NADPH:quinone oxidoreductase family protein [Mycobacterium pinniadriaticum]MCX2928889.1 NADPH:quinone oxidoreductase family protein [Mycobacterium pinniadriaticum]MCX2935244.1 NADPH:quinone oxidoreductase family protein [Mycobacterium pinniadriaticum]
MRAWQAHGAGEPADVLRLVERELPIPGPDQVRVKVAAAGIGLPDVLMCRATYPLTPSAPFTPGQELAGTVTAVGPGVDDSILGTRVMGVSDFINGNGSFAEEALALAGSTVQVPEALDDCVAAGFWIPNVTAWTGLVDRGHLRAGQRLAVLGAAGGSGIAAVQLGKALGATVLAVVGDESRAQFCRSYGADHSFVARGDRVADGDLAQALRAATDWQGVDMVYDPVGGVQGTNAMSALARDGQHLAVGFASGSWPAVDVAMMAVTNTSVVGVLAAGSSRAHTEHVLGNLTRLFEQGAIRDTVKDRFAFDDVPAALARISERKSVGKCVVDMSAD